MSREKREPGSQDADSAQGPLRARSGRRLQEGRGRLGFGRRHLVVEASPAERIRRLVHRDSAREPTALLLRSAGHRNVRAEGSRFHQPQKGDVRFYGPDGRLLSEQSQAGNRRRPLPARRRSRTGAGRSRRESGPSPSAAVPGATLQLRGVPPYLARHPKELLTSREALGR